MLKIDVSSPLIWCWYDTIKWKKSHRLIIVLLNPHEQVSGQQIAEETTQRQTIKLFPTNKLLIFVIQYLSSKMHSINHIKRCVYVWKVKERLLRQKRTPSATGSLSWSGISQYLISLSLTFDPDSVVIAIIYWPCGVQGYLRFLWGLRSTFNPLNTNVSEPTTMSCYPLWNSN